MRPGSTHDLTAARHHGLIATLTSAAIATFADKGYPLLRRPLTFVYMAFILDVFAQRIVA